MVAVVVGMDSGIRNLDGRDACVGWGSICLVGDLASWLELGLEEGGDAVLQAEVCPC